MIAAQALIELVRTYNPKTDAKITTAADEFGRETHEGQYRHSGEHYRTHPPAPPHIHAAPHVA